MKSFILLLLFGLNMHIWFNGRKKKPIVIFYPAKISITSEWSFLFVNLGMLILDFWINLVDNLAPS